MAAMTTGFACIRRSLRRTCFNQNNKGSKAARIPTLTGSQAKHVRYYPLNDRAPVLSRKSCYYL